MSASEGKVRWIERLLFELAAELRFVPVEGSARTLHVRALELKREVRAWHEAPPESAKVDTVLSEIEELTERARRERRPRRPERAAWGAARFRGVASTFASTEPSARRASR